MEAKSPMRQKYIVKSPFKGESSDEDSVNDMIENMEKGLEDLEKMAEIHCDDPDNLTTPRSSEE